MLLTGYACCPPRSRSKYTKSKEVLRATKKMTNEKAQRSKVNNDWLQTCTCSAAVSSTSSFATLTFIGEDIGYLWCVYRQTAGSGVSLKYRQTAGSGVSLKLS